ncbi:MAG: sigma factor [Steroidobacteraceae bacterium]
MFAAALRDCALHQVPALHRLYDLTAAEMLGLLVQMLGDREEAEALLQQGYLAVWQQAPSFNPARCSPRAWLLSVFRQQAIDHLRARHMPAGEVDAAVRLADAVLGEGESPQGRRLLRLAFLTGRTPPELARALGLSAAEVRSGIRQALLAHPEPAP